MRFKMGLAWVLLLLMASACWADEIPVDPAQNPAPEVPVDPAQNPPDELSRQQVPQQAPAAATYSSCNLDLAQDVSIEISTLGPSVDQDASVAGLTQMMMTSGTRRAGMERYNRALGVTDTAIRPQVRTAAVAARLSDGTWCAKLTRVEVTIGFGIAVHLATELKPGTCPYRAVLAHEQKHVAVAQELKQSLREQVEMAVVNAIKRPAKAADRASAVKLANRDIEAFIRDTTDAFHDASETYQLAIDTPAEYDRVHAICGDAAFGKVLANQF